MAVVNWPGTGPERSGFRYYHQRDSDLSTRPIDLFPTGNFPANVAELDAKLGLAQQIADSRKAAQSD